MTTDTTTPAWRCTVCGYIHRGPEPPDECPVCGSPKEYFEEYVEAAAVDAAPKPKRWRCLVCSYEHAADEPPEQCPVCGTPRRRFEAVAEMDAEELVDAGKSEEIVVIGCGIAGLSAVEAIRLSSAGAKITLFSKESHLPYFRLNLTRLLAGEITEDALPIYPDSWYEERRINLVRGATVSTLSLDQQAVTLADGSSFPYDKLILTAGAHPFIPPILGSQREGVTTLRNLDDVDYIQSEGPTADSVAVIGGGILGLETAGALAKQSIKVTVMEYFDWLMPRQLNQTAALMLQKHLEEMGVTFKMGVAVQEFVGDERVAGVLLKSGEVVPANLVVMTAGVRPNSYLARLAGLKVNQGIAVDDFMQTSNAKVYAAGDVAEHRGNLYGLWSPAQYQGSIAGMNAAGKTVEFGGIPRSNSIKVLGVDLFSIGQINAEDGSFAAIEEQVDGRYVRFLFRDSHLVGSILFGDTTISAGVKKAIEGNDDFSGILKDQPSAADICDHFAAG